MKPMWLTLSLFVLLTTIAFSQVASNAGPSEWRDETIQILTELVKIDTSNPPGNETRAAEYIKGVLAKEGIESEVVESAPGRGSVIARLKGNGKKRPLLLMGHLDVVGVERNKWTVDPFAAIIKEDYLYGRGSSDDKGMVAANLEVFLQLKRQKMPLDRDVIFLAEAGEEGTTQYGIDFLVDKHWDKFESEYALNEGGEFPLKDGKLFYAGISTTEKVPRGLNLTAHGSSGHGSMPRMDNAVTHLAAAVAKIGNWQPPARLNETTKAFFARLAQISPPAEASLYRRVRDPKVQAQLRANNIRLNSMLRTSIVPTIIRGGFRENVIPAEAEATLDVRALPDEDIDRLIQTLRKLVNDPEVKIEKREAGQRRPTAAPSRIDSEMFQALERAQKKVFPRSTTLPVMQTGATDSAQLRAKGVQAYGISIPKTDEDTRRVHGNDERIPVEGVGKFVEYLYTVVTDIAGTK